MSQERRRVFNQEFKVGAVQRMLAGENVCALARELEVSRKELYVWRERFRVGGASALVPQRRGPKPKSTGAPPPMSLPSALPARGDALAAAQARIAELEQKVGRQALELDFFQKALRHFAKTRRPDDGLGVTASMRPFEP